MNDDFIGYSATRERAGYYPIPTPGTLRVRGEDRFAFFQRQTTNDTSKISTDRSLVTVLTSPTARILDVLRLIADEESLIVLTLPEHGTDTAGYLKSRVFFMDKVLLDDISSEFAQVELEGPLSTKILEEIGFSSSPSIDEIVGADLWGQRCLAIGQRGMVGAGYRLFLPASSVPDLETSLEKLEVEQISDAAYNVLRVEAGLPAAGAELTDVYTPLEVGLEWTIAENKGCYTGQEVIARQITYDKITQRLVGLHLSQPSHPGDSVWAQDRQIGKITSSALSPRLGEIALAILKRPFQEPGSTVQVRPAGSEDTAHTATVSQLPLQ